MSKAKGTKNGSILGKVLLFGVLPVIVGGACITGGVYAYSENAKTLAVGSIKPEISVSYGTPLTVDLFLSEGADASKCSFASDISPINMDDLASYQLVINSNGYKVKSILNVVDDIAPTATAVPQMIYCDQLPNPEDCVTDVVDKTAVTIEFAEDANFTNPGPCKNNIVLTDEYGNTATIECPFTIIDDHTPPTIEGVTDLLFVVGDVPMFRQGITVKDDYDKNPQLTIDSSQVDTEKVGTYPLTYTAIDEAGNQVSITVNVNVMEEEEAEEATKNNSTSSGVRRYSGGNWHKYDKCTASDAYAAARKVYGSICKSSQNHVLRALKIFYWVNHNISFAMHHTTHASWAAAACQAFGRRYASCFGQWAACKALLDVAGIPNMKVWRNHGNHVWCLVKLNGGWYHCDSTQYPGSGHYFSFMKTDKEIREAWGHHKGFNTSSLPARSTVSVQKYINIYNCTISSKLKINAQKPEDIYVIPTDAPATAAPTESAPTSAAPTGSADQTASPTGSPETAAPTADPTAGPTEAPATQAPATHSPATDKPVEKPTEEPATEAET